LLESDNHKQLYVKIEQENHKLYSDIANMRKDFDNIERKLTNQCADKDLIIRNKEINLESQIENLKTVYENRLIDVNDKLNDAKNEIKQFKINDESQKREIDNLRQQLVSEENNNQEYRETIQKLHNKYKSIIEKTAHEAGRFKTDAFINKTLLEDKSNELDIIN